MEIFTVVTHNHCTFILERIIPDKVSCKAFCLYRTYYYIYVPGNVLVDHTTKYNFLSDKYIYLLSVELSRGY